MKNNCFLKGRKKSKIKKAVKCRYCGDEIHRQIYYIDGKPSCVLCKDRVKFGVFDKESPRAYSGVRIGG
ncbi:MAG: hypothetical protein U9M94_02345 [Patescibacteria group bacterium]|nr:hypothetical protein [Patescibacteria group bacterium]